MFLRDIIAYHLAQKSIGHRITKFSDEMKRLREADSMMGSIIADPSDPLGKMRGGHNMPVARELLKESKDPRYIKNPLYNPKKHRKANGHYLFDDIKKPEPKQSGWVFLDAKTLVSIDGKEFELLEPVKAMPSPVAKEKE